MYKTEEVADTFEEQDGFIALMSAIVFSAILLIIAVTAGFSGFYARSNILDAEFKGQSSALADACVSELVLLIANDPTYQTGRTLTLNSGTCEIWPAINGASNPRIFPIQAVYRNSYTNLRVTVDVSSLEITAWEEVPTL